MSLTTTLLLAEQVSPFIKHVRLSNPLVHCITNDVVQNFTANILLAIGASPAMVVAQEEVADFVKVTDSLLINVGTIEKSSAQSMLLAARTAMLVDKPWVLDPVAVGSVLKFRTQVVHSLLSYHPTVIRGNAAEIMALIGHKAQSKGVDSQESTESALTAAKTLADQYQTIVAVTGATDYVTDGKQVYSIAGGDVALTKVTGTGCSLSAMVAAFIANSSDRLCAAASACYMMKKAAELADKQQGLGSFAVSLLDQLSLMENIVVKEK